MPDVIVPAAPPLVRVRGVELMHAGQWDALSGTETFTSDDFAAAVGALDCPAVRRPVLKAGHVPPHGVGQPALGYIDNLATTDDGRTLIGDYAGIPGWLADTNDDGNSVLSSAYPDRSIEGQWNFRCQIGHLHPFVILAVALLGVERPAIGTLQSLQDLYGVVASASPTGDPVTITICAAAAPQSTGAMIALLPSDADAARLAVNGSEPVSELHVTLAYLGEAADWDTTTRADAIAAVRQIADGTPPMQVDGFSLSVFNPTSADREACIALGLGGDGGDGLDDVRAAVVGAVDGPIPEQRSPWIPHLTLVYTDDLSQVAELADRTGPVTFDRIRVAFAGEHTDFPLITPTTQAAVSAGERSTMPSSRPTVVTAGVTTEDVRREYYDKAPYSLWIAEMQLDPMLQLIVTDDNNGSYSRVPITINGDDITFGTAVPVAVTYVDKPAEGVAASLPATPGQRLVFASRAESRPGGQPKASNPDPPADPAPHPIPDPEPAPAPGSDPDLELPAAEPEPITNPTLEDPVSDLSEFRSRLGLDATADETSILAALDARLAEPTPDPIPVAATIPAEYTTELRRVSEELAVIKAREAAGVKASVLDGAVKAGKLRPADRDNWSTRYDQAPEVITDILASIAPGTAVPVQSVGEVGDPEAFSGDDLSDEALARIFPEGTFAGKDAS